MARLEQQQAAKVLEIGDAVIVEHRADGKIKLHQSLNPASAGAIGGALWGGLIGLLFLAPGLGMAVGAAAGGAAGALTDVGVDDGFMRDLGESSRRAPPRCSCCCATCRWSACSTPSSTAGTCSRPRSATKPRSTCARRWPGRARTPRTPAPAAPRPGRRGRAAAGRASSSRRTGRRRVPPPSGSPASRPGSGSAAAAEPSTAVRTGSAERSMSAAGRHGDRDHDQRRGHVADHLAERRR